MGSFWLFYGRNSPVKHVTYKSNLLGDTRAECCLLICRDHARTSHSFALAIRRLARLQIELMMQVSRRESLSRNAEDPATD